MGPKSLIETVWLNKDFLPHIKFVSPLDIVG